MKTLPTPIITMSIGWLLLLLLSLLLSSSPCSTTIVAESSGNSNDSSTHHHHHHHHHHRTLRRRHRALRPPPPPPVEPTVEAVTDYLAQVSNHDYAAEVDIENPCDTIPTIYLIQNGQQVVVGTDNNNNNQQESLLKPISTSETLEDFYNYNSQTNSFDGSDALKQHWAGQRSLVTIHQSKLTCEMSLVLLNSKPAEGDVMGHLKMWVTGDLHNPVVKDDPAFDKFMLFDEKYDSIYLRKRNMTGFEWTWDMTDSDGMAQPLPTTDWTGCIELIGSFGESEEYFNLQPPNEWMYVSGGSSDGGTTTTTTVELSTEHPLFLCVGEMPEGNDWSDDALKRYARSSNPFPEECNEEERYGVCGYCTRPVCHWHWICNIHRFMNCNFGTDFSPYGD